MPATPTDTNDTMELVKIGIQALGYAVTWAIVLIGWRVNNTQNRKRDDRKELRDQVNDIAEAIRNVEANVVSYLTSADGERTSSYWTVFFGVKQVNASIVSCRQFKTEAISDLLVNYRNSITDKAMPGPNAVLPAGAKLSAVLRDASSAGTSLARGIELRYRELYPFSEKT